MIHTDALTKRYDAKAAVEDLSLDVREGEVLGLLGPNGAGKTTTVRMLAALIAPTSGSARVAGRVLGQEDAAIRASIGFLTESPGIYEKLSARRNLDFYGRLYGLDTRTIQERIEKYLRAFGLWEARDARVGSFSKGMRQKLAIARALLHEPKLLFLDEPTSGLDPESSRTVRQFIEEMRGSGHTILLTTHNLEEADRLCDRIAILRRRLVRVDTAENLRRDLFGRRTTIDLARMDSSMPAIVRGLSFVRELTQTGNRLVISLDNPDIDTPRLVQAIVEAGGPVQRVDEERHTLEDVYLRIVGGDES